MEPVVLETDRLRLDRFVPSDKALIFKYCQDPLFERYLTIPWPYTRANADYFVDRFVPNGWATDSEYTWAVRVREARDAGGAGSADGVGDLLGVIGFARAHNSIGFWLGGPNRGFGYMPEAVKTVAEWVFASGVKSIAWECVAGNLASAYVARRTGFRFAGEHESTDPYRDGKRVPSWHAVLTAENLGTPQAGWPEHTFAPRVN